MAPLYDDREFIKELYESKEALELIDDDLEALAAETGIALPSGLSPKERAKRVSEIFSKKKQSPASFREVSELLFHDNSFRGAIHRRLKEPKPNAPVLFDEAKKAKILGEIRRTVLVEASFALIRNAGKYYRKMVRAEALFEQYRELFQRVLKELQKVLAPVELPGNRLQSDALAEQIAGILKASSDLPTAWLDVKTLAAEQASPLKELADLVGWEASNTSLLIAQICSWLLGDKKVSWWGWVYCNVSFLAMDTAIKLLAFRERVGSLDDDNDFFAGLADIECQDPRWILDAAAFDNPWVYVKVLTEAAPYGVAYFSIRRYTTRDGSSRFGRRLIAIPRDQATRHLRQMRLLLREVVSEFNGHYSTLKGDLWPADDDTLGDFKKEKVRELLKTPAVEGDEELKADVIRLINELEDKFPG